MFLLTTFALIASEATGYVLPADAEYLTWTRSGALIAVTDREVVDLSGQRRRPLRRFTGSIASPLSGTPFALSVNRSGTQGIGLGFVVNLETLVSRPLKYAAVWNGDQLIEVREKACGKYALSWGDDAEVPLASGWLVLGLSKDLQYALATRAEPSDGDETYLLRLQPQIGHGTVAAVYADTSDDHTWLSEVQAAGAKHRILVHTHHLPSGLAAPFFAGAKLKPIALPVPKGAQTPDASIEWINRTTPWAVVRRRLMQEKGAVGRDIYTLDLWNSESGRLLRIATVTDPWDGGKDIRGDGPTLGAHAVDWANRRIAFVETSAKRTRVRIRRFPGLN